MPVNPVTAGMVHNFLPPRASITATDILILVGEFKSFPSETAQPKIKDQACTLCHLDGLLFRLA